VDGAIPQQSLGWDGLDVMTIYLPSIHGGTATAPQAGGSPLGAVEVFVDAWMNLLGSHAKLMRRSDKLMLCAAQHASFLAHRTKEQEAYSMHIGIGHSYPNQRVLWAGYALPSYFDASKNNVESCIRSGKEPAGVLQSLLNSPPHRAHMLGEGWFSGSTVYGVGNMLSDWVILRCPPE